jgi:hypothetical protein
VKKAIQKGSKQKRQVAALAASSAADSAAGAYGHTLHPWEEFLHPWVPGGQVMYVYEDGTKESSAMPGLTTALSTDNVVMVCC